MRKTSSQPGSYSETGSTSKAPRHRVSDARSDHADAKGLEMVLSSLLAVYPEAPVMALEASGDAVPMPESIPLQRNTVLQARSGVDVVAERDRLGLFTTWDRVLSVGASRRLIHLADSPESAATFCGFDLRETHGVLVAVFIPADEANGAVPCLLDLPPVKPRVATIHKDDNSFIIKINETITKLLGWDANDMLGRRSLEFIHPEDRAVAIDNWIEMVAVPGPARPVRLRHRHIDGGWVWFEVTNHNLLADPDHGYITCEMVDISEEMAASETIKAQQQTTPNGEASSAWRREHAGSGLTSRLILTYVERQAGAQAVTRVLARAGLSDAEERLRDESYWFSFETKLALWRAAEEELGDPEIAEHVGAAALDASVAAGLKHSLRALGTPAFVFNNVVRANAKFNWAHELVLLQRSPGYVRMRYSDIAGVGYHRYDCEYTKGLLATVPQLFGLPPASVTHTLCGARGDGCCEFEVRWTSDTRGLRRLAVALAAGAAALAGAGALAEPVLVPVAAGALVAGELALSVRAMRFMRRQVRLLEARVREQDNAAARLLSSLEDLSSDLRLDEVLNEITAKAQTAVGGKEFALLLADGATMRADRHSGIPTASLRALESWAGERRETLLGGGVRIVDDLATDPALAELPRQAEMPLGSMCAAPLVFRDRLLGVLALLAHGSTVFLPGDGAALSAYAAHAAIALSNAHLVERLERQAAEDPLTGLANHRAFLRNCAAEFSRAQRAGSQVSIVMCDLDDFKTINDEYGHPYGDQVLMRVAEALRTSIRGHDTLARMGGDEFAMLLPDTSADTAYEIAERARSAIADLRLDNATLVCSAGVATASNPDAAPTNLVELADNALYQAKRLGRGRTVKHAVDDAPLARRV